MLLSTDVHPVVFLVFQLPFYSVSLIHSCKFADAETIKLFLFQDTLSVVNIESKETVGEFDTRVRIMPPDYRVDENTVIVEQICKYTIGGMPSVSQCTSRMSMKQLQVYTENMTHKIEVSKCIKSRLNSL
jgi:hypothetical protein